MPGFSELTQETFDALANHPSQSKYWSDGSEVTHLDLGGAGPGAHIIMRRDLQKMMVDSLPPEVIFMGHKLESITEDDKEGLKQVWSTNNTCFFVGGNQWLNVQDCGGCTSSDG